MMRIVVYLSFLLFFVGCNGNDSSSKNLSIVHEPYYYQQWAINYNESFYQLNSIDSDAHIHAGDLLESYRGYGIRVAIIDDGLDMNHEDLSGAIVGSYNSETGGIDVSHTYTSDTHGTSVTGIVSARINSKGIAGVASESQIIFLKYKNFMSDVETIELFNKAEEFGADVINCSWGTYDVSQAVREKIVDLANNGRNGKGIAIVFASGNNDEDMGNDESAIPEVISVGATDCENLRAYYSNFGDNLDIMAPGGNWLGITTLDNSGRDGTTDEDYILYDDVVAGFGGTSASAPIVSGVIALMLEKNPNLTRIEIENILKNSADKIGNVPYENGKNLYCGYGKINLVNAMSSI